MRTIWIYGLIAGAVAAAGITVTIIASGDAPHSSVWLGYLIMLVALSTIVVGVKQYRDRQLGGVIRFWPALQLGLGIAAVAGLAYIAVWETYLFATDYAFMPAYAEQTLADKRAAGVNGAAYEKAAAEMAAMVKSYKNPLFRAPMTFIEIFPVGLVIALMAAWLLKNPRFLPASALSQGELPRSG